MNTHDRRPIHATEPGTGTSLVYGTLWIIWQAIRLPLLAFLMILEPIVRVVLSAAALLGVLTALFLKAVGPPNFPFWTMLGVSIGCALLLAVYYGVVRVFSAGGR